MALAPRRRSGLSGRSIISVSFLPFATHSPCPNAFAPLPFPDQARWLGTTLEDLSRRAASAGLDLHIDLYVTRPAALHDSSETTTPVDSPGASSSNLSREKLRDVEEGRSSGIMGAVVHTGRPDILESMRAVAGASSVGHTAVLGASSFSFRGF